MENLQSLSIAGRGAPRPSLTLLDVIATVSGITRNERETAAVVNHMLRSSVISFANIPRARLPNLRRPSHA